jgi:hypothetical protein
VSRALPLLVAVGLVAAVVVPYLALGGASFKPTPVADPCEARGGRDSTGVDEVIEQIALSAVDGVACKLGVSREDLVLALRNEDAFTTFANEHGIARADAEQATRDGLVQAVDNAQQAGALSGFLGPIVRRAAETVPPWLILDALERVGSFLP